MTQTERRDSLMERRLKPTPALSRYFLFGRRRVVRRASDERANRYVDRPAQRAILLAIFLFTLSVLDAVLSLRLFSLGTHYEANPLLAVSLNHGVEVFLLVKLALTVAGTFVLLVHWNFVVAGGVALATLTRLLVSVYVGLIAYEILLLVQA